MPTYYVQWLAKKLVILSIYLINLVFLLEASKKVLVVHVLQRVTKLQAVKILVHEKSKVFIGGAVFI